MVINYEQADLCLVFHIQHKAGFLITQIRENNDNSDRNIIRNLLDMIGVD